MSTLKTIENFSKSEPKAWVSISVEMDIIVQVRKFDGQMETTIQIPATKSTAKWIAQHLYNSYSNFNTLQAFDNLIKK